MEFEIVKVDRAHLAEIAALEKICCPEPWSEQALNLFLGNDAVAFAAAESGKVLGYIGLLPAPGEGQILNLAVFPEARRRGIAKGLVARVISEAQARGSESLSLEVRVSNTPAIRLYQSFGFSVAGTRKGFYRHPVEDALVMIKPLFPNY